MNRKLPLTKISAAAVASTAPYSLRGDGLNEGLVGPRVCPT